MIEINDWVSKYLYSVILCYYISNNINKLVEKLNINEFIIGDEKGERN